MSRKKKIGIIIPALNEEETISKVIQNIKNVMKKMKKYNSKIFVIADGSTDKTAEISKSMNTVVHESPYKYGLADAIRTGIAECLKHKMDIIVIIDADGQYRAEEMPKLIEPVAKGDYDIVLGSRFMGKIERMPLIKKIGNMLFSKTVSIIVGRKISDAQTGFRVFTKEFAKKIEIRADYTYTQSMIIEAVKNKFRLKEIPIYFDKRYSGGSRLMSNPFEYAMKAGTDVLRMYRDYDPLRFFGGFGFILLIPGSLLSLYLFSKFISFGFGIVEKMIPTVLLSMLFILSGIQMIMFAFLADKFRKKGN